LDSYIHIFGGAYFYVDNYPVVIRLEKLFSILEWISLLIKAFEAVGCFLWLLVLLSLFLAPTWTWWIWSLISSLSLWG